jgi:hypothetical protein
MPDLTIDEAWRIMADRPVSVATLEEMGADSADASQHHLAVLGYDVVLKLDGFALRHNRRVLVVQADREADAWAHAEALQRVAG